tara:strand:+ start:668 stop:1852 length:1185 start_codon:yes stop_codon:yes gene_type:complete
MFGINYNGLKKRQTYDEIIDYLMNDQEKIIYPDRRAKFLRNSHQLSNLLDGDGEGVFDMEQQQRREMQNIQREHLIRNIASSSSSSTEIRVLGGGSSIASSEMRKLDVNLRFLPQNYSDSGDDIQHIQHIGYTDSESEPTISPKQDRTVKNFTPGFTHEYPNFTDNADQVMEEFERQEKDKKVKFYEAVTEDIADPVIDINANSPRQLQAFEIVKNRPQRIINMYNELTFNKMITNQTLPMYDTLITQIKEINSKMTVDNKKELGLNIDELIEDLYIIVKKSEFDTPINIAQIGGASSSSTNVPKASAFGLNPVQLPASDTVLPIKKKGTARVRSESRKGTRQERDDPEGNPRGTRGKSKDPENTPKAKAKAKAEAKAKAKAEAKPTKQYNIAV